LPAAEQLERFANKAL
jgi:hypothetical protein